uniref:15-cis-phytoene synthase n=1 Tax=Albugo laibachii Nc14 TaxID=890382 RepID=F0VYL5_9STRA|nr:conserved hypothetical protein [Albugo laibachii Nc14]|eukprot:CCA13879.1 conserved hypothetical protein [Albugo laibachii Nc14]
MIRLPMRQHGIGKAMYQRYTHSITYSMRETVKTYDYTNYFCGLLFPQDHREAYFAIRAFNVETARIRDMAHGKLAPGTIRMQWWREKIQSLFTSPSRSPSYDSVLLKELAHTVNEKQLTRLWFDRILDARDRDLETEDYQTLEQLVLYSEYTTSSLLYLTLELLGVRDETADQIASHAGVAIGLSNLLRAVPFHVTQQQTYMPQELFSKYNLDDEMLAHALQNPLHGEVFAPIIEEIVLKIREHLDMARALQSKLPIVARPAFTTIAATESYLHQLQNANYNVFEQNLLQFRPLSIHFRIMKAHFLRRF